MVFLRRSVHGFTSLLYVSSPPCVCDPPSVPFTQCAKASRLQWSALSDCADGPAINADMVRYGEMTHGLRPPVTFIPTITVDNVRRPWDRRQAGDTASRG